MYQTLVVDEKRFTFSPGRLDLDLAEAAEDGGEESESEDLLLQPDVELDAQGRAAAHWDNHLTTRMTSAGLQKRLLDLYVDAKTLQEEQGVNILYLAIGYVEVARCKYTAGRPIRTAGLGASSPGTKQRWREVSPALVG